MLQTFYSLNRLTRATYEWEETSSEIVFQLCPSVSAVRELTEIIKTSYRYWKFLAVKNDFLGIKPFTCPECPKKFAWKGDLKQHKDTIHSEDKHYECGQKVRWFSIYVISTISKVRSFCQKRHEKKCRSR